MVQDATTDAIADAIADRLAILQLEADYARTWDTRDAAGWAGLFTDDGPPADRWVRLL